jgi:tetratricopeptide (TPR) repeat protein
MDLTKSEYLDESSCTSYDVLQQLGDCYTSVGDYVKAQHCYEEAASIGPDEPGPYVGLGVIALQKNLPEDAEIAFRVACRLGTNCAKAYAGLAIVSQQKQDYQQAFELYMKCLELDNDNIAALLGLFQTSCQMGSFAKIIHYLQTYLDIHPGDTAVSFSLATLYMKDGRFEQSQKILLNLLASDPSNHDAADLLEEVEHNLTRTKKRGTETNNK